MPKEISTRKPNRQEQKPTHPVKSPEPSSEFSLAADPLAGLESPQKKASSGTIDQHAGMIDFVSGSGRGGTPLVGQSMHYLQRTYGNRHMQQVMAKLGSNDTGSGSPISPTQAAIQGQPELETTLPKNDLPSTPLGAAIPQAGLQGTGPKEPAAKNAPSNGSQSLKNVPAKMGTLLPKQALTGIIPPTTNLPIGNKTGFGNLLGAIGQGISGVSGKIGNFLKPPRSAAGNLIGGVSSGIKSAMNRIGGLLGKPKSVAGGLIGNLGKNVLGGLGNFTGKLGNLLGKPKSQAGKLISGISGGISGGIKSAMNRIGGLLGKPKRTAGGMLGKLSKGMGQALGSMAGKLGQLLKPKRGGIGSAPQAVRAVMSRTNSLLKGQAAGGAKIGNNGKNQPGGNLGQTSIGIAATGGTAFSGGNLTKPNTFPAGPIGMGVNAGSGKPGVKTGGQAVPQGKLGGAGASGKAEDVFGALTSASPSDLAAGYPNLGAQTGQALAGELGKITNEIPALPIALGGIGGKVPKPSDHINNKTADEIGNGITSPDLPKEQAAPHQNLFPKPSGTPAVEQAQNQEQGIAAISNISTHDSGINTNAGMRPKVDTSGKADPARALHQKAEGLTQVSQRAQETQNIIGANPGEERIQPQGLAELAPLKMDAKNGKGLATKPSKEMLDYANMAIPANVRQEADARLKPIIDNSLAKSRQDVFSAAQQRDSQKKTAIESAQAQVESKTALSELEQKQQINQARNEVAQTKAQGLKESQNLLGGFNKEAGDQENQVTGQVRQRIQQDEQKAAEELNKGEKQAQAEQKQAEKEAFDKKLEAARQPEKKSWWQKAWSSVKNAVKSAAQAIDGIFQKVRQKIKGILDKAKQAALKLVESGRNWISSKMDQFRNWIKNKVNQYLGQLLPQLASKINNAIEKLVEKATSAVNKVASNLKKAVTSIADGLSKILDKVLNTFQNVVRTAVEVAGAIVTGDFAQAARIVFEAALKSLGIPVETVMGFISNAGSAISQIFKDPIGFLKQLLSAVKGGFLRFKDNILTHLKKGLMTWLFSALAGAGIEIPQKFDMKGIFGLVLQVLGITFDKIKAMIIKVVGEKNVERVEKVWNFFKELMTNGIGGLWTKAEEYLGGLKDKVIGEIRDWVVTTVIQKAIVKLITMFNPAGAIINAIQGIYNFVMFLVEQAKPLVNFVGQVLNSVGSIAKGAIGSAKGMIEKALGSAVPILIGFLARLIGLGGIGEKVKGIITKIQTWVSMQITKMIDKVAGTVKGLFGKGKDKESVKQPEGKALKGSTQAGLNALKNEEQKYAKNGKIGHEDAIKVAVAVKNKFPIFQSITVVDGNDSWDYNYTIQRTVFDNKETEKIENIDLGKAKSKFGDTIFSRKDLQDHLGLEERTTQKRLEAWIKQGLAFKIGAETGRGVKYSFEEDDPQEVKQVKSEIRDKLKSPLLKPGPNARKSTTASDPDRVTASDQREVDRIGNEYGCHHCTSKGDSGKTEGWVGDHMPPTELIRAGKTNKSLNRLLLEAGFPTTLNNQVLYPQCLDHSRSQGGTITAILLKLKKIERI